MIEPGWYDDGVTPNAQRWYDGAAWTEHVRALPAPFAPEPAAPSAPSAPQWQSPGAHPPAASPWGSPGAQLPAASPWGSPGADTPWGPANPQVTQPWSAQPWDAPPARMGADPSDAAHWLLPVGRSWQSITAGYLGLLGLVIWVLAPFALWLGIWAMRIPGGHGRGRAVFAIITGALGTAFGALAVLSWM